MAHLNNSVSTLLKAMNVLGVKLYSDEQCARIIAYQALSGADDYMTNPVFKGVLWAAITTFEQENGAFTDPAHQEAFNKTVRELTNYGTKAEWFPEFAERYGIEKERFPLLSNAFYVRGKAYLAKHAPVKPTRALRE